MNPSRITSRLLPVAALLGLLACATPIQAARTVDVGIIDRASGERLPVYRHDGKLYVAGTPGNPYAIELRSRRGERLLTVLAVDGVNVLNGQTAAPLQSGYVLEGGQAYSIAGWRKSMDDVARFVFTALPDSYAARTGRPDNVGVIGVAVFREKVVPLPMPLPAPASAPPLRDEARAKESVGRALDMAENGMPAAPAAKGEAAGLAERRADAMTQAEVQKRAQRLGTGHGEREYAPTRSTEFVRASDVPDEVITIYYDSRANLLARGIIPMPRPADPRVPNPFPAGGFVPDPRG